MFTPKSLRPNLATEWISTLKVVSLGHNVVLTATSSMKPQKIVEYSSQENALLSELREVPRPVSRQGMMLLIILSDSFNSNYTLVTPKISASLFGPYIATLVHF